MRGAAPDGSCTGFSVVGSAGADVFGGAAGAGSGGGWGEGSVRSGSGFEDVGCDGCGRGAEVTGGGVSSALW
jgi:hypothetical protein